MPSESPLLRASGPQTQLTVMGGLAHNFGRLHCCMHGKNNRFRGQIAAKCPIFMTSLAELLAARCARRKHWRAWLPRGTTVRLLTEHGDEHARSVASVWCALRRAPLGLSQWDVPMHVAIARHGSRPPRARRPRDELASAKILNAMGAEICMQALNAPIHQGRQRKTKLSVQFRGIAPPPRAMIAGRQAAMA